MPVTSAAVPRAASRLTRSETEKRELFVVLSTRCNSVRWVYTTPFGAPLDPEV